MSVCILPLSLECARCKISNVFGNFIQIGEVQVGTWSFTHSLILVTASQSSLHDVAAVNDVGTVEPTKRLTYHISLQHQNLKTYVYIQYNLQVTAPLTLVKRRVGVDSVASRRQRYHPIYLQIYLYHITVNL